jgi:hypothetical protein
MAVMNDAQPERDKWKCTPTYYARAYLDRAIVRIAAHELCDAGFSIHFICGKIPPWKGWQVAAAKNHAEIDVQFRLSLVKSGCGVGGRLDLIPRGSAPNIVLDVDTHGIGDGDDVLRAECMAAVRAIVGDLNPTVITGSGGLHYHLKGDPNVVKELFIQTNALKLDWEGRPEGRPLVPPKGKPAPRWVLELLGLERSVVLPPSVHTDSLQPYRWWSPA